MMRFILYSIAFSAAIISVCTGTIFAADTEFVELRATAEDDSHWSDESNGLLARLSMRRFYMTNGTCVVATYLELKNVRNVLNPLPVDVDRKSMTYRVTDSGGRDIPTSSGPFSGLACRTADLVLPHDSSIRFRVGPCSWGIPDDQAAAVDLGMPFAWALPHDGQTYYLQGTLEIAEEKEQRNERSEPWHGRIELPRVLIPTEPEPVDPAALDLLINDLGAKMLANNVRESDAAVRDLSLIDDPRVIPWYIKAVKTNSYNLKSKALDRLSRFEGDEALAGLKIGMSTHGKQFGDGRKPTVAAQLAVNIRSMSARALARSPHPHSDELLLSMHDDAAVTVRIRVAQAAAKMESPESREVLARYRDDIDESVRDEAARLMKLQECPDE